MGQVATVGIVWYTRMTYQKLRSIFDDGDRLPASFEEWQGIAERGCDRLTSEGYQPIHVYIDLATFPEWCRKNNFRPDSIGRRGFADTVACQQQRDRFKS